MSEGRDYEELKVKMDPFSKVSELLADYAQTIAYAYHRNGTLSSSEHKITKDVLRNDILLIVDEFVQKRELFEEVIDVYYQKTMKKIEAAKKEADAKLDLAIETKINKLFPNFEAYLEKNFKKRLTSHCDNYLYGEFKKHQRRKINNSKKIGFDSKQQQREMA